MYDFSEFKHASEETLEWLKREYSGIRTARATPSILDAVNVGAYGKAPVPILQLATISLEDPKTIRIIPWDKSVTKDIDSAIRGSNLGLSVSVDDAGLRISFPELTSDRRVLLNKVVKEKLEDARIRIRAEREKILGAIDRSVKDGSLSEDNKFKLRAELQKLVEEANKKLEALSHKKEADILE